MGDGSARTQHAAARENRCELVQGFTEIAFARALQVSMICLGYWHGKLRAAVGWPSVCRGSGTVGRLGRAAGRQLHMSVVKECTFG